VDEYFTLAGELSQLKREVGSARTQTVHNMESLSAQLTWAEHRHGELKGQVEEVISRQVGEALSEAGLRVPLGPDGSNWFFPPSQFFLLPPPFVLVTSSRDRIAIQGSYLLSPNLDLKDMENIEQQAEGSGGMSALVERTGGFSLYPAWVSDDVTLRDTLNVVAHEWTHAYLSMFYPLGRGYLLDHEMRTINENVADMVGDEIGEAVYKRYYAAVEKPPSATSANAIRARQADFAGQVRQIGRAVERLLAQGRIDDAESYMETARRQLNADGYPLRRLNQAYLAFHGSYAEPTGTESESPVSPIGKILKDARASSSSLGEFVQRVGEVRAYSDLLEMAPNN